MCEGGENCCLLANLFNYLGCFEYFKMFKLI